MSSGTATVMEYKFTGDVTGATAALQELKARLADINRDSMKFAREAAKGDEDARRSLLQRVAASDQMKSKVRDLTTEVQRFQKASETANSSGWFTKPNMQQISASMTGLAFGVDDFVQQWANTGKLSEGLRGAGNNLTMLAALFGPVAVVATAAATAVATFWARSIEKSDEAKKKMEEQKKALEDYKKSLEDLHKLAARPFGATDENIKYMEMLKTARRAEAEAKQARAASKLDPQDVDKLQRAERLEEVAKDARAGAFQAAKERNEKLAEEEFRGQKEGLKRVYENALIKGQTPDQAKAAAVAAAEGTPEQKAGLGGFINKIAEEVRQGAINKARGRGLEDPQEQQKRDLQAKIEARELALHEFERGADADRRGQNRRRLGRDERHDIEARKEEIQLLRDQLKVQERQLEETKRAREEKLSKVIVPKGIGDAGK